jgi:hypothetical protein
VRRFIIETRKRNLDYGVRQISVLVFKKFGKKISKSTVSNILKSLELNKPVGRSVLATHRYSGRLYGAGYAFFIGASRLLGLNSKIAKICLESGSCKGVKPESLPSLIDAWLIAKAIYNVELKKISGYSKKELWDIIGYKISKAQFEDFPARFEFSQVISNELVTLITEEVKSLLSIKFSLADGSSFYLDAKSSYVWPTDKIPVNFYSTCFLSMGYINSFMEGGPIFVLSALPGSAFEKEFLSFIMAMDGSFSEKRIRKVDFLGIDGRLISQVSFVLPMRRRYVIACPSILKAGENRKNEQESSFLFEPQNKVFFVSEESLKIPQNITNKEVIARLIHVRSADKTQRTALLSNLDAKDWNATEIVEAYLRRFGNFHDNAHLSLGWMKNPGYLDDFVTSASFADHFTKLKNAGNMDQFFSILVEIVDMFAKMVFFPPACSRWSLLKTRELIYKHGGAIKRDMAQDVLFNLFKLNELDKIKTLQEASFLFNSLPATEMSGRKVWVFMQKDE